MLYTLVQQAVRYNLYLYALTVVFQNNSEFELLGFPEPAWSRLEEEEGVLHYMGKSKSLLKQQILGTSNN